MPDLIVVRKQDLDPDSFSDAGTAAPNGVKVRVDATSAVGIAIAASRATVGTDLTAFQAGVDADLLALQTAMTAADTALDTFTPAGAGGVTRTRLAKLRDTVNVLDYGADPTGAVSSSAAIQLALAASKDIEFPVGTFLLSTPIVPRPGTRLRGAGRGMDPYHDAAHATNAGTNIIIPSTIGFDLRGLGNVRVEGFAFRSQATGFATSAYGAPPASTAGTVGIDITGSNNVQVRDVSFHGLGVGLGASYASEGAEARFWSLSDWVANDCGVCVKIGRTATPAYVARDFVIRNCEIALHCGQMIYVNQADGVRLENMRFFQAFGVSLELGNIPFLQMSSITAFESATHNVVMTNCNYPELGGVLLSRAGGYTTATPWPLADNLRLVNSTGGSIRGCMEHPSGRAVFLSGCRGVALDLAIDTPYFTNGLTAVGTNADAETNGAVVAATSSAIALNVALNTESVIYGLSCDAASAPYITGTVSGGAYAGVYRAQHVNSGMNVITARLPVALDIGAGGSAQVDAVRVLVPAGKSVISRSARVADPVARVRSGATFFTAGLTNDGDGWQSFQAATLFTNSTAAPVWTTIPLQIHNPTAALITVPAGTLATLSIGVA